MVSRKKRRIKGKGKAREAAIAIAKAAKDKEAVAVSVAVDDDEDEEARQQYELELGPPQQLELNEEESDGSNEEEEEEEDDNDKPRLREGQEIESTIAIDEATGQAYLIFSVAIVNGRFKRLNTGWEETDPEDQRLQIIEQRNCIAEKCDHGCHLPGESTNVYKEFMETFDAAFVASRDAGERDSLSLLKAGVDATFIKYADVWKNAKMIEWVRSFYLSRGARIILEVGSSSSSSSDRTAFMYASIAQFFAQYIVKILLEAQPTMYWPVLEDLLDCDDFSLVRFFKEGIPCSCLDEKYDEASSSLDESHAEWNNSPPPIQEGMTNIAMKETEEMESLVEAMFETDHLFLHALPDSHTLKKRIHIPKTKPICIECPKRIHVTVPRPPAKFSEEKLRMFYNKFTCECNTAGGVFNHNIRVAYLATREDYADMWNSSSVLENMSSIFLVLGTEYLLRGYKKAASNYASLAYCFEQHIACNLLKERLTMNWPKINELFFDPDEHTLVSFFKKRITCSCLDEKYKQVKSVKKLGLCYNINCPHLGRKVERSLTKCCSLCRRVNYCSRECQVDNWNLHQLYCHKYVEKDAAAINLD